MSELAFPVLEIVSCAGGARNAYIEAIAEVKSKNYERCNELVAKGNELYQQAHRIHTLMIQQEVKADDHHITLMITHAQDIMMSAECFKILCDEFIDLYRRLDDMQL